MAAAADRGRAAAPGHRPAGLRGTGYPRPAARLRRRSGARRHRLAGRPRMDGRVPAAAAAAPSSIDCPMRLLRHRLRGRSDQARPGRRRDPHAAGLRARPGRELRPGEEVARRHRRARRVHPAARPADLHRRASFSATGWPTHCPSAWACSTASANSWPCPRSRSSNGSSARHSPAWGRCARPKALACSSSPRLDEALEQLAEANGEAGGVRSRLMAAAFDYAKDVGRDHVDIDALAEVPGRSGRAVPQRGRGGGLRPGGHDRLGAGAFARGAADQSRTTRSNGLPAEEASRAPEGGDGRRRGRCRGLAGHQRRRRRQLTSASAARGGHQGRAPESARRARRWTRSPPSPASSR